MSDSWHYIRLGNHKGPVPSAELKRLASVGELAAEDLIWKEGMTDWAPANRVKGLFVDPPTATVPPPIPPVFNGPPPPPRSTLPTPSLESTSFGEWILGLHPQRRGIIAFALAGMMATFLPWAHAPLIGGVTGAVGDGWITLALFIPALVLASRGENEKPLLGTARLRAVIPAAIATAIGLHKMSYFKAGGIGLTLLVLAGISLVAAAWLLAWSDE